jgi:predicted secreted Zn-dependent protease
MGWGILLLGASDSGYAQVTYQIKTNYYIVSGGNLRDIHRSLQQNRPWRETSTTDGRTDWKIRYNMSVASTGNGCRLNSVTVRTAVTITLPTLQVPPGTEPQVTKTWQQYLVKLMAHEQKHLGMARASAHEMLRRIQSVGTDRDCGVLKSRINSVASQVMKECTRQQADYDRRTRHGVTEGVVLPRYLEGEEPPRDRRGRKRRRGERP